MKQRNIVVIGGGTGTSVVLSGLREIPNLELTAIVSVADSGGSTGRLRDEFGFLPVGDLRQALSALASEHEQPWISKLLLYRFSKGSGLEGHNLGNLILTALQDMTGSTAKAIEIASQILNLTGKIIPVTTQKVDLVVEYEDGTFVIGEHHLNPKQSGGKKITKVRLSPRATLYTKAKQQIEQADLIIIGPGDVYASIMPNLIVSGMKTALQKTQAKIVYIVNLMTSFTQTHGMTAGDHVQVIEDALGRPLDYILFNNKPITNNIRAKYEQQQDYPVINDLPTHDRRVITTPMIMTATVSPSEGDTLVRSYLRHDPAKLAHQIMGILDSRRSL